MNVFTGFALVLDFSHYIIHCCTSQFKVPPGFRDGFQFGPRLQDGIQSAASVCLGSPAVIGLSEDHYRPIKALLKTQIYRAASPPLAGQFYFMSLSLLLRPLNFQPSRKSGLFVFPQPVLLLSRPRALPSVLPVFSSLLQSHFWNDGVPTKFLYHSVNRMRRPCKTGQLENRTPPR